MLGDLFGLGLRLLLDLFGLDVHGLFDTGWHVDLVG
jgi:hypothetical protein